MSCQELTFYLIIFASSKFFRELRVSDIGELKRAVLLKKTQRSLSAGGTNPCLESLSMGVNDTIQNQELQKIQSDLNNNSNTDTQSEADSPPSAFIQPRVNHFA